MIFTLFPKIHTSIVFPSVEASGGRFHQTARASKATYPDPCNLIAAAIDDAIDKRKEGDSCQEAGII